MGSVLLCCYDLIAIVSWMGSCGLTPFSGRSVHPEKSAELNSASAKIPVVVSRED